jgi:Beta-lactamase class C and other penicillin binding proteins
VTRTQATSRAPSLVAAVIRGGRIAHCCAAGTTPTPALDLQYRLGSVTKTMTAAVVLGLRDAGHLNLDDLVTTHLPTVDLPGVRLRHLLGHASGLQREPDGPYWLRHPGVSLDELLARVTPARLAFGRYERAHYSNIGYGLLGGVIERVTGNSWWEVVASSLLTPLGMTRTTYHATEPYARGYLIHPWDDSLREEPREDAGAMAPAGQLWSTVDDMARFVAALTGHHPTVLSPATVDEMARPVMIADPDTWTLGYGLGMQLFRCGERVYVGHTGSMPGYLAALLIHRRSGTGVIAFTNTYTLPGTGIGRTAMLILDAVLDGEPEPSPPAWRPSPEPAPADVRPLLGVWWWMGRSHTVRWEADGTLVVAAPDEEWRFTREGPDRWRGLTGFQEGEILTVLRDPDGTVVALDIATFIFRREPLAD